MLLTPLKVAQKLEDTVIYSSGFGGRVAGSRKAVHNHTRELTVQLQSCLGDCFALLKLSEVKYLAHR